MRRPEGFEALCRHFPALERLTSSSEPTTKVLGAGLFENRWTRYGAPGGFELQGFFAVGDSFIETNPMYGRGCTAAFMQAHLLANVFDTTENPSERARLYYHRAQALLKPYFDISVSTDRVYQMRARLCRGLPIPAGDRLVNYLYERAWLPATQASPLVAREFLKAVQMRENSSPGRRLRTALHILRAWLSTSLRRNAVPLLPGGPQRGVVLNCLPAPLDRAAS
jgi:hypothetical protein